MCTFLRFARTLLCFACTWARFRGTLVPFIGTFMNALLTLKSKPDGAEVF